MSASHSSGPQFVASLCVVHNPAAILPDCCHLLYPSTGDCLVVAVNSGGLGLFDLFGNLVYQLPYSRTSFPIRQLEISRPIRKATPQSA